ncbi:MAG: sigma-70 family RNA polymerase sigma factor [bacterium]
MCSNQDIDLSLLHRIRSGDKRAFDELVIKYNPMIRRILRKFYFGYEEIEDLIQEGMIGLIGAVREYDETRFQVKFSSFAYMCILRKLCNVIKGMNNKKNLHWQFLSLKSLRDFLIDYQSDPMDRLENIAMDDQLFFVLKKHLSVLEFRVILFMLNGYSLNEIAIKMGIQVKSVDNARTRAKLKIKNMVLKYGSLFNPQLLRLAK